MLGAIRRGGVALGPTAAGGLVASGPNTYTNCWHKHCGLVGTRGGHMAARKSNSSQKLEFVMWGHASGHHRHRERPGAGKVRDQILFNHLHESTGGDHWRALDLSSLSSRR